MLQMKKIVIVLIFAIAGMNISAQESGFTFRPFFGGGGFSGVITGIDGHTFGGVGEYAFLFFDNGLQMGGHIIGRGDLITTNSGDSFGAGSILGKLSLGGFSSNNLIRSYSFLEGGIGFGGGNGTTSSNLIFGGGGGIDFFFHRYGSVYFEVGYLQHFMNNELLGGVSITIGTRGFITR
ncbi:MAG: hypothetical protein FWC64_06685 [Treponema sp.]|nr:hypothetical protein [Treponema sp.]